MATAISQAIAKHAAPAIKPKRESQAVVDVLTCKKVAEALQRVSGVSISREFSEGERVSICDAAPNLARTI
jgi:iron complex outermembrane receptor protein